MILSFSLVFIVISLGAALCFTFESYKEHETRALNLGLLISSILLVVGTAVFLYPALRMPFAIIACLFIFIGIAFCVSPKTPARSSFGAMGHAKGTVTKFDQRDTVFCRNALKPGTENYEFYYKRHPDREEQDTSRRKIGGPLGVIGSIDNQYKANVELIKVDGKLAGALAPYASGFQMSESAKSHLSSQTQKSSDNRHEVDPEKASEILKGFAKRLGACLVGMCEVNEDWAYSHNGKEDWGKETPEQLPYAVVFATEMNFDDVSTAPHTTSEVECSINYAEGAYISTVLASWIDGMGYKTRAHHTGSYELVMPPLGVDAGLGEMGRFGYVITDKYGPRVRIFAVTTDMVLKCDPPLDIGAEAFCQRCKKCATTCPSRSIPEGEQTVNNGLQRWKIDAESCFNYWGKIGTGCTVCMAICPFSRPNRSIHKIARWCLKKSDLAAIVFPHIDNFLYGTKWRSKKSKSAWNSFPKKGNS